jgi:hypothetical protein
MNDSQGFAPSQSFIEWLRAGQPRREPESDDRVWPDWMPPQMIEQYRRNRWRVPAGKFITRTGYSQPVVPGYRVHHESRWVGTDCYTWYFEPLPEGEK